MSSAGSSLQQLHERAARAEIPLSALVELTHACNLQCQHCYLPRPAMPEELSTGEWRRVLGELARAGCLFLTFSGGEPFLRRDWFELAEHARSLGFALRFYSNGTLVTVEAADKLASLRPLGVDMSLLGACATTHDDVARAPGAFERMTAAIRALRARNVPVLLKAVLLRRNVAEHEAMRRLAGELGCDIRFDIELSPKNNGDTRPTQLTATGRSAIEATRRQLYRGPNVPRARDTDERAAALDCGPCRAGRNTCHITPCGDVTPCTQWVRPSGNLRSKAFRDIWRDGQDFVRLRRTRLADLPECARCEILDVCSPCLGLSLLENGNWAGPAPSRCRSAQLRAQALGLAGQPAPFPSPPPGSPPGD